MYSSLLNNDPGISKNNFPIFISRDKKSSVISIIIYIKPVVRLTLFSVSFVIPSELCVPNLFFSFLFWWSEITA